MLTNIQMSMLVAKYLANCNEYISYKRTALIMQSKVLNGRKRKTLSLVVQYETYNCNSYIMSYSYGYVIAIPYA